MTAPVPLQPAQPDPPPASWLRVAGLITILAIAAGDLYDGVLDADVWSYLVAAFGVIWGPSALSKIRR